MTMVNRGAGTRSTAQQTPAERVMTFLRKSKAQGFGGRTFEVILYACKLSNRDELRALLTKLEESGRIVREPGERFVGSHERAEKWRTP
jgi:hypothetical protein